MTRIIKFRQEIVGGKDRWHYWGFLDEVFISPLQGSHWGKSYQFTGLLDKNGKEIYEGDLLSGKKRTTTFQVIFEDGGFKCHSLNGYNNTRAITLNQICKQDVVIGNIYENPDLLKEESK